MKPLPTLTKPLRSVDIATKEPAQALRERTDSCTVPAAGVVGEAMVALVLAARLPGQVRRRPHRRRARARSRPTRSGSDGGRRSAGPAPPDRRVRALVLVGFMGAGKSTAARTAAARWASSRSTPTGARAPRSASRSAPSSTVRARRVPRARGGGGARAARPGRRARRGPGRRLGAAPSASATPLPSTRWCSSRCDPEDAWRRASGSGRPLARDPGRFEQLQGDREPLYAAVAHAVHAPRAP